MDTENIDRRAVIQRELDTLHRTADDLARTSTNHLAGLGSIYTATPGSGGAGILQKAVDAADRRAAVLAQMVDLQTELDSLD